MRRRTANSQGPHAISEGRTRQLRLISKGPHGGRTRFGRFQRNSGRRLVRSVRDCLALPDFVRRRTHFRGRTRKRRPVSEGQHGGRTRFVDSLKQVRLLGLVRPVGGLVRRMNVSLPALVISKSRKRVRPGPLAPPFDRSLARSVNSPAATPQRAILSSGASVAPPVAAIEGCALGLWMMWLLGAAPEAPWSRAAGAAHSKSSSSTHLQLPQEAAFEHV